MFYRTYREGGAMEVFTQFQPQLGVRVDPPMTLHKLIFHVGILIELHTMKMDVYTLCRMFRSFTPNPTQPSDQTSILFYAGHEHAVTIGSVLRQLDFDLVAERINPQPDARWLDFTGLKLFS